MPGSGDPVSKTLSLPSCHKLAGEADGYRKAREEAAVPGVPCRHGQGTPGGCLGEEEKAMGVDRQ